MESTPPPVTPIRIDAIEAARKRIAETIVRTPLIKLQTGERGPEIYLKLENLQPINSFKLRGAANAVACLEPAQRAAGVWTISAGNAGQGVAYAARKPACRARSSRSKLRPKRKSSGCARSARI